MAALTSELEGATQGRGSAVYLFGDAGSGKSRVLRELVDLARARGLLALPRARNPGGSS